MPYIEISKDVKLLIVNDQLIVMEILNSKDWPEVEKFWGMHESNIRTFENLITKFRTEIRNNTHKKSVSINKLKDIIDKAETYHQVFFLPKMKKIHDLMKNVFLLEKQWDINLNNYQELFKEVLHNAKKLEQTIKLEVNSKLDVSAK